MSGSQWIFFALVAIVTAGGFIEASAHEDCRRMPGRVLLAFVVPVLWCFFIQYAPQVPWPSLPGWLVALLVLGGMLLGPMLFVASIVVWMGWALSDKPCHNAR